MAPKFKNKDKVILTRQIDLFGGDLIPLGAKGQIAGDGSESRGKFLYKVVFEKYPDFSPQYAVLESHLAILVEDAIDLSELQHDEEFAEWLEDHVQKRIGEKLIDICKRGLGEDISMAKLSRITGLSPEEVKEIQETIAD